MKKFLNPVTILLLVAAAVLLLSDGGLPFVGSAPPFKTDKLAMLIVEESSDHGDYTADQLNAIQSTDPQSIKVAIESQGGEFQVIDDDVAADRLALAPAWVREAFQVPRESIPWVVAAGPRTGFSVPLVGETDLRPRVEGLK